MNAYKLIAASIMWCLESETLSTKDYRAFLEHLCLIAIRAKDNSYKDSAHVDYVLAVRRMAEKDSFAAFAKENSGESIVHYGPQNMLTRRTQYNTYRKRSPMRDMKRP